ncbi:ABC transporter substrate-binding protein [Prosthecobacter sp.]|uniref:ABC transporter substrate-binding protein n=1 Tax=Prosthecobacter sp. TaxID=1965333 RepID=UPI00248A0B44|nr:ABC transporter substrate-binding protein [Prosthecobacter sp.]MDI1312011.1 ABC transporter substrate-binding protein [Prosthecobacter sp.]
MILARTLIIGFPLLVAAAAGWSVHDSSRSRTERTGGVVAMLSQSAPVLNPFLPATELEHEISDLVHEPLIRLGGDGTLQPGLAEFWRWTQDLTCWFANEAAAKHAQDLLHAQIGENNRWTEWHLGTVRVLENRLLLSFTEPNAEGVRQAFEVIAGLDIKPVVYWRIERRTALRQPWDKFMAGSKQAGQIQRVWFDGANACEIVVAGDSQQLLADLHRFLDASAEEPASINPLGEIGALSEPVLDLDIRPGQHWHDGTPATAEDAKATLEFLRTNAWPLPNREALSNIQTMESQNKGTRLHVSFRRRQGTALCVLVNLPILPAAWLRAHPAPQESDFVHDAPPGAGTHRIISRDPRSLFLTPVQQDKAMPSFMFNFAVSPLMTQIGVRTHTVDLVWPAADRTQLERLRFTPPRQRLVVLWNTRNDVLKHERCREALALATDTDELIRTLPGRLGHADASLFAPNLWFSTLAKSQPFQLEQARKILAEAGWPRDDKGIARSPERPLRFTLLVPSSDALHTRTADLLVAQWRKLGAEVKIELAPDAQSLAQRLHEHRFDAVLLDQRFEVSWDQLPWWHSAQAKTGGSNFCGISDPQTDLILEALAAEYDPEQVPRRVRELESRLLPLHPMLTLFTTHDEAAAMPTLREKRSTRGPVSDWTLQTLTGPPRLTPTAPLFKLQLRTPE